MAAKSLILGQDQLTVETSPSISCWATPPLSVGDSRQLFSDSVSSWVLLSDGLGARAGAIGVAVAHDLVDPSH